MGRDTEQDYRRRQQTPGEWDHFRAVAGPLWRDAEDKQGLPEPTGALMSRVYDNHPDRLRGPQADVLTPELVRTLAKAAEGGTLRRDLLVVPAHITIGDFKQAQMAALHEAGLDPLPPKARKVNWLGMLFLYLAYLSDAGYADLARKYLFDGEPHEFGRDRDRAKRLTTRAGDMAEAARRLLRSLRDSKPARKPDPLSDF